MTKLLFCPTCSKQQPATKTYLKNRNGAFSSRKVWCCMVCGQRLFVGASKFRNKPTASKHTLGPGGKPRMFQSKLEANREPVLLALQNAGHIKDLRYQVPFSLEVYGTDAVEALLTAVDAAVDGSVLPEGYRVLCRDVLRSKLYVCSYRADFTYLNDRGELVVEDPKGHHSEAWPIKRKLMAACHNIDVVIPKPGGIQQRARGAGIAGRGTGSRLSGNGR